MRLNQFLNVGLVLLLLAVFHIQSTFAQSNLNKEELALARPSSIQYKWHEQERLMFVCIDPCTWQGREYDNHSVSLERINPEKLNTDQWCEVALSWGAKEILFVAKHTGGVCWWQTETTDYGIRNTSYKNGTGDVLKELSESCKKYGLNLGIYVYPGDETWGAGIDTTGLIPEEDVQLYKDFGEEINRRFGSSLAEVENVSSDITTLYLPKSQKINHVVTMEDYRQGHRIREYSIESYIDGKWKELYRGLSVGRKKNRLFLRS